MQWIAIAALCENAVKLGGAVVALALGYGLPAVLLAAIAGAVAGSLVSASRLRALGVRVGWSAELAPLRELARAAPTFLFIALFATLYWRIDLFMLAQMRDLDAVGAYGAAWRLLELSLILPQSVCLAIYPQLAAAGEDTRLLARLGGTSLRLLLAAAVPLAVGISVLAPQVIGLLYGAQFASAAPTLAVLIWTLIPYLWVRLHAYVLVAADHQHVDLALNVAMTVLNVALNLVLIPPYGHWGAALATLITMLAYGAAQYAYLVWALPGRAVPLQIPLPALLGGIAMGAVLWTLRAQSLLTTVVAAAVLYGAALVASGITAGGGRRFDLAKVWRQFDGARS
jgi:O-antigen/teichoic acid export membrane protein